MSRAFMIILVVCLTVTIGVGVVIVLKPSEVEPVVVVTPQRHGADIGAQRLPNTGGERF